MEAKLIVVGGKANRDTVTLKLPAVIGRSRDADLTVAHPMISRRHCQVFEVDGLMMIRDLGSLNGTVVEGQRVTRAAVRPQDEVTVGPLTFRAQYEYHGDLDSVPPPEIHQAGRPQPESPSGDHTPESPPADQVPSFAFLDNAGGQPADERLPDVGAWEQVAVDGATETDGQGRPPGGEAEQFVEDLDEVEESVEFEIVEDEDEEPQPTPPPPSPSSQELTVQEAVDQTVQQATIAADGGEDPAKTIGNAKVETLPDLSAAADADTSRPAPPQDDDEKFSEFLKGLE